MMSLASLARLSPDAFERLGSRILLSLYAGVLGLTLLLLVVRPEWLPLIPGLLLGGAAGYALLRYPTLNFIVLVVGFYLISGYSEGVTPVEVLYALYYLGYIGGWFLLRWMVYRRTVVQTFDDALVFFLLLYASASIIHNLVLGGDRMRFINEWMAFLFLAFYFPAKEATASWRRGPSILLWSLITLGTLAGIRNIYVFITDLTTISRLWQFLTAREPINQHFFLVTSLLSLTLWLYEQRRGYRWLLFALFGLNLISLIITQQRAFWLAFALGVLVLFLLVDHRKRLQLFTAGTASMLAAFLVGWYALGHSFWLILAGLFDRLLSIATAFTTDISLINRYLETEHVWKYILRNPIAGYGLGTPHKYYDLIHRVTMVKTWIHNGFVAVWYKFGLLGFMALFTFWGRTLWLAWKTFRASASLRVHALMSLLALFTLLPITFTENPFHNAASVFLFALLTGWAHGLYHRYSHAA